MAAGDRWWTWQTIKDGESERPMDEERNHRRGKIIGVALFAVAFAGFHAYKSWNGQRQEISSVLGTRSGGLSDDDVREAYAEWLIGLDGRVANQFGNAPPSDGDKDAAKARANEIKIRGCKDFGRGFYMCDVEGEETLWDLQRYDGRWKITGFESRPAG